MAKKTTTESKEITIDQENFKQHGEAFVEAMLRGMLTFDSPDDLFNEESGDYEYFGETLVPGDEGGYTRAVSWMESWVNPGFDKWAKGYGGTKTKKEIESFMLEAETDYVKAAEDVLNDAFNAVPLAKKLKATFSLDSDSFGDYGYVVSMGKAYFEKARKSFLTQNITSNGKPVKVNSAIFYKISKDALIAANYKEANDTDIRCAVCMWYRGFGQFCPRFWVSVNPDNVCDKHVRLPAKAELKIANGNAAKSNEYDFIVNVFTQEGKKVMTYDDFKIYETTEDRAIKELKRIFVEKYPGKKFAYLLAAKNDKFYGSKLPPYSGEFNSNEAKKAGNAGKKPKTFKIVQSYDIAGKKKGGFFEESGWEDEEGIEYPNTKQGIEDAAKHLKSEGASFFDNWFSTEPQQDYKTGEERTDHFHIHVGKSTGIDAKQEVMIAEKIATEMGLKSHHSRKNKAK